MSQVLMKLSLMELILQTIQISRPSLEKRLLANKVHFIHVAVHAVKNFCKSQSG